MSSTAEDQMRTGGTGDPSPEELARARALLDSLEARVFSTTTAPPPAQHIHQTRAAARRLFGHGR
jgi:hypothetical protein